MTPYEKIEAVRDALTEAVENNPYDDDLPLYDACANGAARLTEALAELRGEEAAFLESIRAALCNACVLMQGWHSDGTDWSEWDQSVHEAAQKALGLVHGKLDPLHAALQAKAPEVKP